MESRSNHARKIKLALVSCGLGHVNRGMEVSTARWHRALAGQGQFDLKLFCGNDYPGGIPIENWNRDALMSGPLKHFPLLNDRRRWELCYGLEQISFACWLLPELVKWKPDVIWTKEAPFAHILACFRRFTNLRYKIIFANGGGFRPETYRGFDYIQHLQIDSYEKGREYGIAASKMQVLCNCVSYRIRSDNRQELRAAWGYTDDDWVIISVAAWNRYHKRIDYLINEVAAIEDSRVKLLLVGHPDTETPALERLAEEKLSGRVTWRTLSEDEVGCALHLSDVFVLPSINEYLGGAMIEAILQGLPVITHPHPGARFVLPDSTWQTDLSEPGNLTGRLLWMRSNPPANETIDQLRKHVMERFSENALVDQFSDMVRRVTECAAESGALINTTRPA